jgi:hypothetical protein
MLNSSAKHSTMKFSEEKTSCRKSKNLILHQYSESIKEVTKQIPVHLKHLILLNTAIAVNASNRRRASSWGATLLHQFSLPLFASPWLSIFPFFSP